MMTHKDAETEFELSSGNVFEDLKLRNADKLKIKSGLAAEILHVIKKLGLTQEEAAQRIGISQPKVSNLMQGDFSNLSEHKLMESLNRLGYDIEIKMKPTSKPVGQMVIFS